MQKLQALNTSELFCNYFKLFNICWWMNMNVEGMTWYFWANSKNVLSNIERFFTSSTSRILVESLSPASQNLKWNKLKYCIRSLFKLLSSLIVKFLANLWLFQKPVNDCTWLGRQSKPTLLIDLRNDFKCIFLPVKSEPYFWILAYCQCKMQDL